MLLTVDDSFQRNCCASRAYLEGNEGFLAYFSSSILALSLCGIINPLKGVWCSLLSSSLPWSHLVHMVTARNKHLFHQDKRWSQKSGDKGIHSPTWVSVASSYAEGSGGECEVYFVRSMFLNIWILLFLLLSSAEAVSLHIFLENPTYPFTSGEPLGRARPGHHCLRHHTGGRPISILELMSDFEVCCLGRWRLFLTSQAMFLIRDWTGLKREWVGALGLDARAPAR